MNNLTQFGKQQKPNCTIAFLTNGWEKHQVVRNWDMETNS